MGGDGRPDAEPFAPHRCAKQRVWTWKDDFLRCLTWYGRFLAGRASFLSPVRWRVGAASTITRRSLSRVAHDLARILAREPLPSAELRAVVGDRARYDGPR
jgi:hypothetical protein